MCVLCRQEERIWQQCTAKKRLQVQAHGIMETAAKKNKIVKPGDHIIVPLPDMDWAKIDAHSLHAVIVEENNNGEFKLGQGTF